MTTAPTALTTSPAAAATALARRFAREARRHRGLIILWLTYEVSRLVFFFLSRRHGLLQGVSVVSYGVLAFGAWLLLLRLTVFFFLPLAIVSRVARRLWLGEVAPSQTAGEVLKKAGASSSRSDPPR